METNLKTTENWIIHQVSEIKSDKLIKKRLNEVVVSKEFTYQNVLETILKSYLHILDKDGLEPLIRHISSRIDFQTFREVYCDGMCKIEPYFQYHYNQCSVKVLLDEWDFKTEKFCNELVIPFLRTYQMNFILELMSMN